MRSSESTVFSGRSLRAAQKRSHKQTGAQILINALIQEGVNVIFGYPGGAVLNIYDELYRAQGRLRHIRSQHEQGAVHMADGYARASGKVGVALVTSGPGLTNAVTGIATAQMDSVPLIIISGQVARPVIGTDAFQEVDAIGITRPCCKKNYQVKKVESLPGTLKEAFHLARTGRPGPVLIDIPKDVAAEACLVHEEEERPVAPPGPALPFNPEMVHLAADYLLQSERPVLYVGGGIIASAASEELTRLAEMLQIPVTPTLMGLGAIPATHPLFLGMLGMHGTYCANMAMSKADLIFAVGARFDDRVTGKVQEFGRHARIVHVDVDPHCIGKIVAIDVPVVGDARSVLTGLLEILSGTPQLVTEAQTRHQDWLTQIRRWQLGVPLSYRQSDQVIQPQFLIQQIARLSREDAIVTTDVGQHQMWAAQYYPVRTPRQWITSGGLGTMGFGLPAAIGAQFAYPQREVIALLGDGGFLMTCQELATAVHYQAPVKVVIMNNRYLGMVRQWQEFFYEKRFSQVETAGPTDFVKLAEAFGARGLRTSSPQELPDLLAEGFRTPGVVVMEVQVSPDENVFPMVPSGKALNEMVLG
jgi:acetolactate synthase I/II/III large subunit